LKTALLPHELTKKQKHHYTKLHRRFSDRHKATQERVWKKHKEALDWMGKNFSSHHLTAGSLGSLMLLAPVSAASIPGAPQELPVIADGSKIADVSKQVFLVNDLKMRLP